MRTSFRMGLVSFGVLLTIGLALVRGALAREGGSTMSMPRPTIDSSPQEVARFAIEATQETYPYSGTAPQVVVARRVSPSDVESLGLRSQAEEGVPMTLVVLRGDFDISRFPGRVRMGGRGPHRAEFITYVYDLRNGTAYETIASPTERALRSVLKELHPVEGGGAAPRASETRSVSDEIAPTASDPDEPNP